MPRILPAALRALFAGLALMLFLSACGLKGDLVLPDASATPASAPAPTAPEPGDDSDSEDEGGAA